MRSALFFLLLITSMVAHAQINIITTIAGTGVAGFSGDGGRAIDAEFDHPNQVCVDKFGSILIADAFNNRIRKIDAGGNITTTAGKGTGTGSYSGDGGVATNANLWIPDGICSDTMGNIYIADGNNHRIRKVTISTGVITTVAGNGIAGNSGDGNPATNAELNGPEGVAVDKAGNIYICNLFSNNIRKVNVTTGLITTVAGTSSSGYSGDGELAIHAQLSGPGQPIIDSAGNIIFTDVDNSVIRKILSSTGIITTIAGIGTAGYSGDGGPATNAKLHEPYGICFDKNWNIYFAEYWNGAIRKIDAVSGIITTVAGNGTQGYSGDGGLATNAQLKPNGVVVDANNNIIIADYLNHRIRKVYSNVGVGGIEKAATIIVYPNPASNAVTIVHAESSTVSIYNLSGQEVFKAAIDAERSSLDVSQLPTGNYVLKIIDEFGKCLANKLTVVK